MLKGLKVVSVPLLRRLDCILDLEFLLSDPTLCLRLQCSASRPEHRLFGCSRLLFVFKVFKVFPGLTLTLQDASCLHLTRKEEDGEMLLASSSSLWIQSVTAKHGFTSPLYLPLAPSDL